ncbi:MULTISPECIES: hypothetical protein [Photorhabdus]|nr:hypothetical protein [Photorhabdus asymbiotica]
MTEVNENSQQSNNLKDEGYNCIFQNSLEGTQPYFCDPPKIVNHKTN